LTARTLFRSRPLVSFGPACLLRSRCSASTTSATDYATPWIPVCAAD
ncbi:uncharacterized protein METZ01_LOCUS398454, partial [marine metagenome]